MAQVPCDTPTRQNLGFRPDAIVAPCHAELVLARALTPCRSIPSC
jgi:hypothetical protein